MNGRGGANATFSLIGANIAVFLIAIIGLYFNGNFIDYLALNPASVLQGHYLWTFLTSMFAHVELLHLFVNMMSLLFIGSLLESLIGKKRFVTIYLLSGLFANLFFLYLEALFSSTLDVYALGASGAIFGIAGTLVMITPKLPVFILFIPLPMPLWFGILFLMGILWLFSVLLGLPIGNTAHLGGLVAGLIYGWYLRKRYGRKIKIVNKLLGLG